MLMLELHADACVDVDCPRRAFDGHVIPYGAVGGLLTRESKGKGTNDSSTPVLNGQAFCSLPVTPTGLPVHVNGKLHCLPWTYSI